MKKLLLILAVIGGTAVSCFAQSSSDGAGKFSIGIDAAIPTGTASNAYNAGFGGSIKYEIPAGTDLFATVSAGYEAFFTKSDLKAIGANSSYGFVPLKAGLKYYFGEGVFGEAQVGAAVSTSSGGGTAFAYSPGLGYTMDGGFEVGLRYEAWSKNGTFGQFALRLAYRF